MKNIQTKIPLQLFFLCIVFLLAIASCDRLIPNDKGHPEYFDKVIQHADSVMPFDFTKGYRYLDSAYRAFPQASPFDLSKKYRIIATYTDSLQEGLMYIDSALVILEKQVRLHPVELLTAYNVKANIYTEHDDFDNAFKYLYKAKELSETIDIDNSHKGFINMSLGSVLFRQKKYKEVFSYYKTAIEYYKNTAAKPFNSFVRIQACLNGIGLCYERLNQLDSATIAYTDALAYVNAQQKNFPKQTAFINAAKGVIYGNLASNYVKQHENKKAEEAFLLSLKLDKIYREDNLFNQIKLAQLYLSTDRLTETAQLIDTIQKHNDSLKKPSKEVNLRFRALVWNYYEHIGNVPKAYQAFRDYHKLKDSADLFDAKIKSKDINNEFVKYEQRQEIADLKKKDEVKTVTLIFAFGLALLSLLVIFLIWRNYRITQKNNRSLQLLNTKISSHNLLMEKTLEALEQSQEENTHLMQVVAHDMRTPIAGVIGLTSLLLEENELNEEQREIISMINTSGTDTLNFINDLLQVQYNKSNMIKEPVEIHTLLKYCITLLHSKASEKNQELKIDVVPIELNISREKIWRVMSNLISNAIKFSPHGTTIQITMEEKPLSILISVKDNGIGIPPELADKLFAMNADVQRPGTDGEKSFGLGLAISKQIIEAHNGNIWFESLPGLGTTFFVELPITEN